jgi:hypothetical protein
MDRDAKKLHSRSKIPRRGGLHDNLTYFKVPQAGIDSIRSKLVLKIFDEYANILKGMYSTRFNGHPKNKGDHDQMDTAPVGPSPPLITSLQVWQPNKIRRQKEKEKKGVDYTHTNTHTLMYIGTDRTYHRECILGCIT